MALIAQTLLYLLAVAGVVAGSLGAIFFLGGAMNRARPAAMRVRRGALAALCALRVVASAALGFVGAPAILYWANR